ncbi:Glrx5 [Symbiodinium necroappetens]|nr:Glrx5 [Symbiodinium sp. KB8]CAE7708679.1 Glrx5 [Symbiodinium necroappetens]CAE7899424.1 Glrx5 [Symbiodinium microadriaticum]|mmetsp:Transcript_116723/g.277389  ORF Transcript_116723/g.277389 Transcript_116723/m.277389 type:complete len:178 (-) Transcript_116723:54-587(-)|eukprot:CAMPEP_0181469872 /NCGR_PEP_ID=MMETSP1110-20121109/38249_1 /TAXON_ID=174948 /ORGANISM="Symbiodinium sp., Strain CCMP421" /LENGTH=177 /DNA_ID=CAMNT_0023594805 /DNA_START=54 /DNA_END=587 /DNA_ORIENTATION=+
MHARFALRRCALAAAVRVRPIPLRPAARSFAASPLDTTAKLYDELVDKSLKEYQANQKVVAADLDAEISNSKVVLFMEGTPDAPKSEPSLNAVKMLTEAQVVPMTSVNVLTHPAILGYTVAKTQKRRTPHLYVNGSFYADYDGLLAQHGTGQLAKNLGTEATKSSGVFGGELPIATY